jgi:uncharacterized protein (TIGR02302 family)
LPEPTHPPEKLTIRLERLARGAQFALSWEKLWPAIVVVLGVVALFLIVSWLGLWLYLPRTGRIAGLVVLAALLLVPFIYIARFRLPSRSASLGRIDRDSGLPHRPATTLDDQLANAGSDPATTALWRLHKQRAEAVASQLKIAAPSPGVPLLDRYAVRGGLLIALVAAAFVAGPEKYARLLAAFDFNAAGSISQGYRLDAWIDPPPYTGRAPQVLRLRDETGTQTRDKSQRVEAPSGSFIIMRSSEGAGVTADISGGIVESKPEDTAPKDGAAKNNTPAPAAPKSDAEKRWTLNGDGKLTLRRLGSTVATFDIVAIPDRAPIITLKGDPKSNARGSMTLAYKIEDDYGVVGAEAEFKDPILRGKPVTGRTLVEPPKMPLALASGPGGLGDGETTGDLSEHPWAGARVTMTLTARDEAGNIGRSEPKQIVLPQRTFVKPLARALVEQRRNLVFSPDDRKRVSTAIEALMIDPDRFQTGAGPFLGLQAILKRLQMARTDDQLRETADLMWEMALQLEEGDLSSAERDLRAAQQALRDAMNRGASDEELRKLMDQMRAALDKFMQELAERQMRDQNNQDQQADNQRQDPNTRFITPQDLRSMLDRMEDMARSGNMADAQRMLDQLQNLLENLQTARRQNQQNSAQREMNRALNQLDQMMRDQQELRDQTFQDSQRNQQRSQRNQQRQRNQQGQQQRGPRQQGQQQPGQQDQGDDQGDDDQDSADNQDGNSQGLQQRQEALRKQLQELQKRMREMGMPPEQGFGDAEGAMGDAEGQLGEGTGQGKGKAVESQGKALEGLRKGAQSLAQQMQQQGGQPGEQSGGPGDPNGPGQRGNNSANPDPLGRESRDRNDNSRSRYDPLGVPAAQRAQRVLEELRKRLGDPSRPQEELDYLERLLRRY